MAVVLSAYHYLLLETKDQNRKKLLKILKTNTKISKVQKNPKNRT